MSTLNSLSHGVKISITRSINTAFEQYMVKIMWDEERYNLQDFMKEWQHYIQHKASWYNQIDEELKTDSRFHEELAQKINEVVEKTFSEEPTAEQIKVVDALQEELGTDYDYSCKAEARFYIDFLKNSIKKKTEQLNPADERELGLASLLYYQVYDADLPAQSYTKQDIHYIIQLLQHTIQTGHDGLQSAVIH